MGNCVCTSSGPTSPSSENAMNDIVFASDQKQEERAPSSTQLQQDLQSHNIITHDCDEHFLQDLKQQIDNDVSKIKRTKQDVWKNLDFMCLDNSLRETTVGQLTGHTVENKKKIFQEIEKCGFTDIIVASFNSMTRVDDDFVKWLQETQDKEAFSHFYSFSEITIGPNYDENGHCTYKYNTGENEDDLPVGMKKNKLYGLVNTIFEADLASDDVKWGDTWTVKDECELIDKRIRWIKDNISKESKIMFNMRDFPDVMIKDPLRMLSIVKYLSQMPQEYRLYGLLYEDPMGAILPTQLGNNVVCLVFYVLFVFWRRPIFLFGCCLMLFAQIVFVCVVCS